MVCVSEHLIHISWYEHPSRLVLMHAAFLEDVSCFDWYETVLCWLCLSAI